MAKIGRPSLLDDKDKLLSDTAHYTENHAEYDDLIPSLAGLAVFLGAGKQTILDLKKKDDDFSCALDLLSSRQEKMLTNGGLSGQMNSTITKLMLHNHGHSEKIDSTSSDGSMSPSGNTIDSSMYKAAQAKLKEKIK